MKLCEREWSKFNENQIARTAAIEQCKILREHFPNGQPQRKMLDQLLLKLQVMHAVCVVNGALEEYQMII